MIAEDHLIRGTAENALVRFFAARTTGLIEEARRRHNLTPTACAALGRLLTAGAMMGSMLKEGEDITLQVRGDGPLGGMMVVASPEGEVRGYVRNPAVDVPLNNRGKLDVSRAVGKGMLYVIKDLKLKEPYRGGIPLVSGEIAEDLTYYFSKSEQIPSAVSLGVLVDRDGSVRAGGGFILQLLPEVDGEVIDLLESRLSQLQDISRKIDGGKEPEAIVEEFFKGLEWKIQERKKLFFRCTCSREKMKNLLISLGEEEVRKLLAEEGVAEARCHFCNQTYRFDEREALEVFEK